MRPTDGICDHAVTYHARCRVKYWSDLGRGSVLTAVMVGSVLCVLWGVVGVVWSGLGLVKNGPAVGARAWCQRAASVVLSYGQRLWAGADRFLRPRCAPSGGMHCAPCANRPSGQGYGLYLAASGGVPCRTMLYFWRDLHVSECQLDELWSFVHTKEAHLPGPSSIATPMGTPGCGRFAPAWRLVLAFVIGKRDQAGADLLLARVAHVTDDFIPLFTSDQLPAYRMLLNTYGEWYQPPWQGRRGAYPKPRRRPPPSLRYAQVVKRRESGRIVQVSTRVVSEPQKRWQQVWPTRLSAGLSTPVLSSGTT